MREGDTMQINVNVNGTDYAAEAEPRMLLVDFIRTTLGLTGTHLGCEHGDAGRAVTRGGGGCL